MNKIAIVGSPGAGKSTLACQLGDRLNMDRQALEVIHLDKFYWQEDWQEPPREKWIEFQEFLLKRVERWIIDGTYLSTSAIRLQAADTIIFLDRPRLLCLWRVIRRHYKYRKEPRPDFSDECLDKLDLKYTRKVWSFPEEDRPTLLANIQTYGANKAYFCLRSQQEINCFLQSFSMQQAAQAKNQREPHLAFFPQVTSSIKRFLKYLWDNLDKANLYCPFPQLYTFSADIPGLVHGS